MAGRHIGDSEQQLLEDAQIKLSVVASDIFGVSGRQMMAALLAGERDPAALAQLARASMRRKIGLLEEAFVGHFRICWPSSPTPASAARPAPGLR